MGNGVCGAAFDRATIAMNKVLVATLQGQVHVFDVRTRHPTSGAPLPPPLRVHYSAAGYGRGQDRSVAIPLQPSI